MSQKEIKWPFPVNSFSYGTKLLVDRDLISLNPNLSKEAKIDIIILEKNRIVVEIEIFIGEVIFTRISEPNQGTTGLSGEEFFLECIQRVGVDSLEKFIELFWRKEFGLISFADDLPIAYLMKGNLL
jgi:hypothetical protein